MDTKILHTTELDYVHMSIKKLQNIIKVLEYYGYVQENQSLIKVLNKRVNKRCNSTKEKQQKNKTLIRYKGECRKNGKY